MIDFATYAPEVSGQITDAKTGAPIKNASLIYTYLACETIDETQSDETGAYKLTDFTKFHYLVYIGSPGKVPAPPWIFGCHKAGVTIEVSAPKYNPKVITIDIEKKMKPQKIDISLSPGET